MNCLLSKPSTFTNKIILLVTTLVALYAVHFILFYVQEQWLNEFIGFKTESNYRDRLIYSLGDHSILHLVIISTLAIPIWEELFFRSCIIFSRKNMSLFLSAVPFIILPRIINIPGYIMLISSITLGLIVYKTSFILLNKCNFSHLQNKKITMTMVILTSFAFGFGHIFNYQSINIYSIILIIPNIIAGFAFSYVRIKNGLTWSITMHIINNLPGIITISIET